MTYVKPHAFTRHVVNPVVVRLNPGGVETFTVPGRRSGVPRRVPVIPVEVEGARYLVSPYGEAGWVRNLRVSGTAELSHRGKSQTVRADEVPVAEREPVIAAYRKTVSRAMNTCFETLPDAKDHPVFRVG